ncbi:hypothetical protein FO519_008074 [Halicephalobus sp. NKZ332]|nr:hypothetical protein FO519_008074 [Halicephalobus sp. NKZ332]
MIPSRTSGFHTRMAMRKSWLQYEDADIMHKFVIGFDENEWTRKRLDKEARIFNDLVITDIVDSYKNLSLKTFVLLNWQQTYCPNVSYVLKSDDDTVVHLPRLKSFMENYLNAKVDQSGKSIFGRVWTKVHPRTSPTDKWYVPKFAWKKPIFPDYCNGPTYLLTSAAITAVLNATATSHLITVEDALFTGILAEKSGVRRINEWKMFGKEINAKSGCTKDSQPQPWIVSGYDFYSGSFVFKENVSNPISTATKKLFGLSCS